jgi:hypothetical protein
MLANEMSIKAPVKQERSRRPDPIVDIDTLVAIGFVKDVRPRSSAFTASL